MRRLLLTILLALALASGAGATKSDYYMFPAFAKHDGIDQRVRYPKVFGESGHALAAMNTSDDLAYLVVGQFRLRSLFSSLMPTFSNHVVSVVCGSTKKQMVYVYAESVVAVMADLHTVRNSTMHSLPCISVSEIMTVLQLARANVPISSHLDSAFPESTAIRDSRWANVGQKQLVGGLAPASAFTKWAFRSRMILHGVSSFIGTVVLSHEVGASWLSYCTQLVT